MDASSTVDNNYSKFDGVNNSHKVAQVDEIESNFKKENCQDNVVYGGKKGKDYIVHSLRSALISYKPSTM
ncbi:hypothetical protein F8M41_012427 [Gigaspora margarita]|uniref:Uncharacterized protein n=1 Tax=Gigaspora margarita TaxID=4874 RepID=A0A8H4AT49_GIGMA|nr:hypothetical protein F8M41_012427 [Gigaspora margarita]